MWIVNRLVCRLSDRQAMHGEPQQLLLMAYCTRRKRSGRGCGVVWHVVALTSQLSSPFHYFYYFNSLTALNRVVLIKCYAGCCVSCQVTALVRISFTAAALSFDSALLHTPVHACRAVPHYITRSVSLDLLADRIHRPPIHWSTGVT